MRAYVIGTCDTKYEDLRFVKERIGAEGVPVVLVDVGTTSRVPGPEVDVSNREVAACHPERPGFLDSVKDRGRAVAEMGEALAAFLQTGTISEASSGSEDRAARRS